MDKIVFISVWETAKKYFVEKHKKIAAVSYVSSGSPIVFGKGDLLICDASDRAIGSGETNAEKLSEYFENGAKLFSCANLHSKMLISGQYAIIGSANLSKMAEEKKIEGALISTRSQIRSQILATINLIKEKSIRIDVNFINRIKRIPVKPRLKGKEKPIVIEKKTGNRFWLVSTVPTEFSEYENEVFDENEKKIREENEIEEDIEIRWWKWTGKSLFRTKCMPGDTVIEINKLKKMAIVKQPQSIIGKVEEDNFTALFIHEPDDLKKIGWAKFEKLTKGMGFNKISKNSVREISPKEIHLFESIWEIEK